MGLLSCQRCYYALGADRLWLHLPALSSLCLGCLEWTLNDRSHRTGTWGMTQGWLCEKNRLTPLVLFVWIYVCVCWDRTVCECEHRETVKERTGCVHICKQVYSSPRRRVLVRLCMCASTRRPAKKDTACMPVRGRKGTWCM